MPTTTASLRRAHEPRHVYEKRTLEAQNMVNGQWILRHNVHRPMEPCIGLEKVFLQEHQTSQPVGLHKPFFEVVCSLYLYDTDESGTSDAGQCPRFLFRWACSNRRGLVHAAHTRHLPVWAAVEKGFV